MKLKFLLFLLFAALIATTVVNHVRADDDDEDVYDEAAAETAEEAEEEEDNDNMYEPEAGQGSVHPLTDMPEASPDIIAAYVFPNYPSLKDCQSGRDESGCWPYQQR